MFLGTQYHPLVENRNDATDFITKDFPQSQSAHTRQYCIGDVSLCSGMCRA
jgi:hypothetical protein